MRRATKLAIFLLSIATAAFAAQSPGDDIQFTATFVNNLDAYHIGEPIPIQITYSAQTENKYWGSWTTPGPRFSPVTVKITPADGFMDPWTLLDARGMGGSIMSSDGYLTSKPRTMQFDLTSWYRFQKPGRYLVTVIGQQVYRVKSPSEGGGKEQLTLESQPLELNIVPSDSLWAAQQFSQLSEELQQSRAPGQRAVAISKLALLDTPSSVASLTQLYLENSDWSSNQPIGVGLLESLHTNQIVDALQAALRNPAINPPDSLIRILATLQTRQELGIPPSVPNAPADEAEFTEKLKQRDAVRARFVEQDEEVLAKTIQLLTGTGRAHALYQEWFAVENSYATSTISSEKLTLLRNEVLDARDDLDHQQQVQFLALAWDRMPHAQLLPLVLDLTKDTGKDADGFERVRAYEDWCQDWPEDCEAAILADVSATGLKTPRDIVLLLHPAARPQFDPLLKEALVAPDVPRDGFHAQQAGAVLMRAGSKNLIPDVDDALTKLVQQRGCAGNIEGDMVGYLFRVAPDDAARRLATVLQVAQDHCGSEVLRVLHFSGYSSATIPVVTRALNSPNLQTAASAALFLAEHADPDVREALWQRLETLWKNWSARAADLQGPFTPAQHDAELADRLEQSLASALIRAKNWTPTDADRDRLRAGCLTDRCRSIGEGKMYLNF
jgi:hypothetical protein